jgi:2-polyprenyl-3-methyl-5-hydroxy-6-metoxy-1,4-benzoquinol methylase
MTVTDFYDRLALFYHLIYPNWDASIGRQALALDGIIKDRWGKNTQTVLDVACSIGTQSLGLATLGYTVTASDLSSAAVAAITQSTSLLGFALATSRTSCFLTSGVMMA